MNANDVIVESSWKIENIDHVKNKILWKEQMSDLTEETNIDNCFMMSQTNAECSPCTLKIVLTNNRKFAALQILSEVPMIEVHGQHEEYITTVRGELLDEVEGTPLYECRIDLKKLQPEIFLKFCKLKDISNVWIYCISAVTKVVEVTSTCSLLGEHGGGNQLMALMQGFKQKEKNFESVEFIVNKKLGEMEERLTNRIEERFSRLEKKIEEENAKILTMLSDLKTNK